MKTLDDLVIGRNGLWFTLEEASKAFRHSDFLFMYDSGGSATEPKEVGVRFLDAVISKEQFQQRAKELGFINGYRYGVEYKTDGKRPNLPDDVVVCINGGYMNDSVDGWDWPLIKSFKITDRCHKPADTSYLEKTALEPVPEEEKWWDYENEKMLSNPPVDLICEVYSLRREQWVKAKVLNAETGRKEMAVVVLSEDGHWSDLFWCCKFRPTDHAERKAKAERKRVVDAAQKECVNFSSNDLGRLYDKGFLKLP